MREDAGRFEPCNNARIVTECEAVGSGGLKSVSGVRSLNQSTPKDRDKRYMDDCP